MSDTPASTMNLGLTGTPATTATYTIAGTAPSPTSATTYNFTLRATDAESQTTDRAFSITITVGYKQWRTSSVYNGSTNITRTFIIKHRKENYYFYWVN